MRSKELLEQISAQFEEMHCFLKKKEEEIKKQVEAQERAAVRTMCKNTSVINDRLMDGKELECVFQSALDIKQPDLFLQVTHYICNVFSVLGLLLRITPYFIIGKSFLCCVCLPSQWWNEKGFPVTERMKIKNNLNPDIM